MTGMIMCASQPALKPSARCRTALSRHDRRPLLRWHTICIKAQLVQHTQRHPAWRPFRLHMLHQPPGTCAGHKAGTGCRPMRSGWGPTLIVVALTVELADQQVVELQGQGIHLGRHQRVLQGSLGLAAPAWQSRLSILTAGMLLSIHRQALCHLSMLRVSHVMLWPITSVGGGYGCMAVWSVVLQYMQGCITWVPWRRM